MGTSKLSKGGFLSLEISPKGRRVDWVEPKVCSSTINTLFLMDLLSLLKGHVLTSQIVHFHLNASWMKSWELSVSRTQASWGSLLTSPCPSPKTLRAITIQGSIPNSPKNIKMCCLCQNPLIINFYCFYFSIKLIFLFKSLIFHTDRGVLYTSFSSACFLDTLRIKKFIQAHPTSCSLKLVPSTNFDRYELVFLPCQKQVIFSTKNMCNWKKKIKKCNQPLLLSFVSLSCCNREGKFKWMTSSLVTSNKNSCSIRQTKHQRRLKNAKKALTPFTLLLKLEVSQESHTMKRHCSACTQLQKPITTCFKFLGKKKKKNGKYWQPELSLEIPSSYEN